MSAKQQWHQAADINWRMPFLSSHVLLESRRERHPGPDGVQASDAEREANAAASLSSLTGRRNLAQYGPSHSTVPSHVFDAYTPFSPQNVTKWACIVAIRQARLLYSICATPHSLPAHHGSKFVAEC